MMFIQTPWDCRGRRNHYEPDFSMNVVVGAQDSMTTSRMSFPTSGLELREELLLL